jgi:hypothetical protein
VDPVTGNLAVAAYTTAYDFGYLQVIPPGSRTGHVVTAAKASGTPGKLAKLGGHRPYSYGLQYYFDCGYDSAGNLFADGLTSSDEFGLVAVPAGSYQMETVFLGKTITVPGAVQWDGRFLAVGDESNNTINRSR